MRRRLCLLFNVVFIMTLLVGCNNPKNLTDTFMSIHTNSNIIKVLKLNGEAIVLYTSNKDYKIRAAEFSQTNSKWKMLSDVSGDNTGKLSFGCAHKGQKNEVLFGEINDPNIKKIQVKKENGEVLKATIVNESGRSYWYVVWTYGKANLIGLSKNGQSIFNAKLS
jgi:hypothetical protein